MIRALLRLLGIPRRNPEPPKPRHVPAGHGWRQTRAYVATHRRLAAELGIEWGRE